ncbi:hypothetical protein C9J21_13420 [Photobacterium phosphoreum]|uniref:Uncharacterized protein n=1 Tax=Photobacterium phosphoreum TaxID=659 RepID=A0A2T3PI06_PHOPO|nr:YeeE/YedE family protein [Photobacterium phosphoreum]PSU22735.1 hypothetical protein CTM96_15780 [Photobacterium phosphoreum]PSU41220.1 hypothetical protein CTM97_14215 [Photobacterium phosphoreum]PSU48466.1 hypothetical protein C9J18_17225 [Photobacterium phosphoreum]PSW32127.1 hypothetical protein C9J21_13420 [Photobacterium phosphoreum]
MTFQIPWQSFLGGMLLGVSAVILMLFIGKTAGISGIINGVIKREKQELGWKIAFLVGMVVSVFALSPLGVTLPAISEQNIGIVLIAGLLVGFGTRLGNGCTSGHGIVGMGRFSKRSIYATCVFMISAIIVVFIRRLLGDL